MSELLLTALWLVACGLWYIAGRDHGRRKALKGVDPYVQFANGEWTATSEVTRG